MLHYLNRLMPIIATAAVLGSCSGSSTTNTQEETEIRSMDSTAKTVDDAAGKLDDQNKKVEESLEQLDNQFDTTEVK